MAFNTHLQGFTFDGKAIMLERWSGVVRVELPPDVIAQLKKVCHEQLPKQAPAPMAFNHFEAVYDHQRRMVLAEMTPDTADWLAKAAFQTESNRAVAMAVHVELRKAYHAYEQFKSPEGEPGLDPKTDELK